eukprot:gene36529-49211_t
MKSPAELKAEILRLTREYSALVHTGQRPGEDAAHAPWSPGQTIPYAGRVFDENEVEAAVGSTLDFWLTLGPEGEAFEKELAALLGVKHSLLVNSGSSANLIAISALTTHKLPAHKRIMPGDEVITVAAGFPTTVAPILQVSAVPVFIDNDPFTGNARVEQLESAASQPNSAMDMISRIPGFSFDGGDNVRGYGGAAGNVLIDGQRPATKSESLEDALRRIQASQVERVDIIRGGAPGIDMQGKTVIANVVLRKDKAGQWLIGVADIFYQDGRSAPAVRFEGTQKFGEQTFDWSILGFTFVDDGAGEGPRTVVGPTGALLNQSQLDETGGGRGYTFKSGVKSPFLDGKVSINAKLDREHYEWSLNECSLNEAFSFPAPGALSVNDDFIRDEGEVGANWERALGPNTRFEFTGLIQRRYTDFSSTYVEGADDAVFLQQNESGESIARGVLRYTISPTWSVESGGELAFNFLDSAQEYVENGVPVTLPAANVRVEERRGEVFGSSTWRLSPKLSLE